MENYGGIISVEETSDSSTTALWKSYQQSHLVAKQEELIKEIINFVKMAMERFCETLS
jgi:hypothetical protein